jgi:hypothetical protein
VTALLASRAPAVVLGTDFSDPTNERIIFLSAAGLALVGIGLLVGTILWWRRGRQEHPALSPLEVMGSHAWAKSPEGERQRRLERVRLPGAAPAPDEPVRPEPVDLQALVRSVPQAFDDLREPGEVISAEEVVVAEVASPPAVESTVFVVESNGDVVEMADAPSADVDEHVEPDVDEHVEPDVVASNGDVVPPEVVDPDATLPLAERPLLELDDAPAPLTPPVSGETPVTTDLGVGSEALASSPGDTP